MELKIAVIGCGMIGRERVEQNPKPYQGRTGYCSMRCI